MAALWEWWEGENGRARGSCAAIVTGADDLVHDIRHRMSLILAPAGFANWLDFGVLADAVHVLDPQLDQTLAANLYSLGHAYESLLVVLLCCNISAVHTKAQCELGTQIGSAEYGEPLSE